MAEWMERLANGLSPWAAIRAIMACHLVALDMCPGTSPVGIKEIFCRLFAKLVIWATGNNMKTAYSNLQLCAGTEAGIEGAVHAMQIRREQRWAEAQREQEVAAKQQPAEGGEDKDEDKALPLHKSQMALDKESLSMEGKSLPTAEGTAKDSPLGETELTQDEQGAEGLVVEEREQVAKEWEAASAEGATLILGDGPSGTTLVDVRNGFNELSHMAMLWKVRHRWPKGAHFLFNCYC
eukprot:442985-Ditylum_brightwellii.AAC.1